MKDSMGKSTLALVREMRKALQRDSVIAFVGGAVLFWLAEKLDLVNLIHTLGYRFGFYKTDAIINFLLSAFVIYTIFSFSRFIEMVRFFKVMLKISRIDYLTKIYNRRALIEELDIEFSKKERYPESGFSFILFDIDDFKDVNDSYGHNIGDVVLIEVADIISKSVRKSDICGRFGGDEFGILLPLTDLESSLKVAKKILKTVSDAEFSSAKSKFGITLSIGVVEVNSESDVSNMEKLINEADKYLYLAKQKGKNAICSRFCTGDSPFK